MITFTIPGKPVPQERRVHIRGQWAFDPPKSRKAKAIVKQYAMAARPKGYATFDKSYVVKMYFYGPHWGSDIDNLSKLVLDAIKGVYWKDDHQVVKIVAQKFRYCSPLETVVSIEIAP